MIELTEHQAQALERPDTTPPRVVNPRTKETFVLLRVEEYERIKEEYDDSPWTRKDLEALAWERVKHKPWDKYDVLPEKPRNGATWSFRAFRTLPAWAEPKVAFVADLDKSSDLT